MIFLYICYIFRNVHTTIDNSSNSQTTRLSRNKNMWSEIQNSELFEKKMRADKIEWNIPIKYFIYNYSIYCGSTINYRSPINENNPIYLLKRGQF